MLFLLLCWTGLAMMESQGKGGWVLLFLARAKISGGVCMYVCIPYSPTPVIFGGRAMVLGHGECTDVLLEGISVAWYVDFHLATGGSVRAGRVPKQTRYLHVLLHGLVYDAEGASRGRTCSLRCDAPAHLPTRLPFPRTFSIAPTQAISSLSKYLLPMTCRSTGAPSNPPSSHISLTCRHLSLNPL